MILQETYDALARLGMTSSQYDFSERWIGRDRSYLSSTKARERDASSEAMLTLATRLTKEAIKLRQTYKHGEAEVLDRMSGRVWETLLGRANRTA
jgi:hypothetical protein